MKKFGFLECYRHMRDIPMVCNLQDTDVNVTVNCFNLVYKNIQFTAKQVNNYTFDFLGFKIVTKMTYQIPHK